MSNENILKYTKIVVKTITGMAVSKVVKDVVANNTAINTPADKAFVWVGSAVLGSLIADHATDHALTKVDEAATMLSELNSSEDQ